MTKYSGGATVLGAGTDVDASLQQQATKQNLSPCFPQMGERVKRAILNLFFFTALAGFLSPFLGLITRGDLPAYVYLTLLSYTALLLWAFLSFIWKATWFELKVQIPVAFILTAITTPAFGRTIERLTTSPPNVIYIFFHMTMIAVVLLPALGDHIGRKTDRQKSFRPKCASCGYDLTDLDKPRCPECGTPFAQPN